MWRKILDVLNECTLEIDRRRVRANGLVGVFGAIIVIGLLAVTGQTVFRLFHG